ncbi:VirD4 component [Pseudomonas syringae pv. actinidiae]|uniref:VirD4 component n=1 Tax=Pseudomonas syringae pv. actinidiae TaxID=103796 RepID=A0AAN4QDI4_PSESF|nr:VirD4 component [Pseudomonas syringae pv. actinidiae]
MQGDGHLLIGLDLPKRCTDLIELGECDTNPQPSCNDEDNAQRNGQGQT